MTKRKSQFLNKNLFYVLHADTFITMSHVNLPVATFRRVSMTILRLIFVQTFYFPTNILESYYISGCCGKINPIIAEIN